METVWTNNVRVFLTWKPDDLDAAVSNLYLNNLHVGTVFYSSYFGVWKAISNTEINNANEFLEFPTEQEAKDHLVDTMLKGLLNV